VQRQKEQEIQKQAERQKEKQQVEKNIKIVEKNVGLKMIEEEKKDGDSYYCNHDGNGNRNVSSSDEKEEMVKATYKEVLTTISTSAEPPVTVTVASNTESTKIVALEATISKMNINEAALKVDMSVMEGRLSDLQSRLESMEKNMSTSMDSKIIELEKKLRGIEQTNVVKQMKNLEEHLKTFDDEKA